MYCEVEKKSTYLKSLYILKLQADSDDIYRGYQRISQVFSRGKIFLEYSSFVEISTKNRFFQLWENAIFGRLTTKNAIFWRKMTFSNQYAGFGSKKFIDTLYNFPIINIGHIGRFIQNRKFTIFEHFLLIFHTQNQPKKIKSRKLTFFGSQTQFFTPQTNLNWFVE